MDWRGVASEAYSAAVGRVVRVGTAEHVALLIYFPTYACNRYIVREIRA